VAFEVEVLVAVAERMEGGADGRGDIFWFSFFQSSRLKFKFKCKSCRRQGPALQVQRQNQMQRPT